MSTERKIVSFIAGFLIIGCLAAAFLPKEEKKNSEAVIRIGAGDDLSGILMQEIAEDLSEEYEMSNVLESTSFQDC